MLRLIICSLLLAAGHLHAQTDRQSVPLNGATTVHLSTFLSAVTVTVSDGPDLELEHILIINGTPRPDLTELSIEREGSTLTVNETAPTMEMLEPEMKKKSTIINGKPNQYYDGHSVETRLIVKVPAGQQLTLETLYGDVAVTDVVGLQRVKSTYGSVDISFSPGKRPGPMDLYSNYGAVDLSLPPGSGAEVNLITEYGTLMTDLDIDIDKSRSEQRAFYEQVVGKVYGGGAQVQCKAPYGNVYLRKSRR